MNENPEPDPYEWKSFAAPQHIGFPHINSLITGPMAHCVCGAKRTVMYDRETRTRTYGEWQKRR